MSKVGYIVDFLSARGHPLRWADTMTTRPAMRRDRIVFLLRWIQLVFIRKVTAIFRNILSVLPIKKMYILSQRRNNHTVKLFPG